MAGSGTTNRSMNSWAGATPSIESPAWTMSMYGLGPQM